MKTQNTQHVFHCQIRKQSRKNLSPERFENSMIVVEVANFFYRQKVNEMFWIVIFTLYHLELGSFYSVIRKYNFLKTELKHLTAEAMAKLLQISGKKSYCFPKI